MTISCTRKFSRVCLSASPGFVCLAVTITSLVMIRASGTNESQNFPRNFKYVATFSYRPHNTISKGSARHHYLRVLSEALKWSIKLSEPDQDCLIRPYLGRRRRLVRQSRFQAFSLRNYPLHIDQIEELELDGILYPGIRAETLADLYWRAHIDANDVEFVLAPPGRDHINHFEGHSTHQPTIKSHILEEHVLWILDFDCCKHIPMDEIGVEQAVVAFYKNDPFYSRPGRNNVKDQTVWTEL